MQLSVLVFYLFALFALAQAQLAGHNEAASSHHQLLARQAADGTSTAEERAKCNAICAPPNTALRQCAATPATRIECAWSSSESSDGATD